MEVKHFIPSDFLKPYVKSFTIVACKKERRNILVPDTSLVMALPLKGNASAIFADGAYALPLITGIRHTSRIVDYASDTATLLVHFTEGNAVSFLHHPLHELFENAISLEHFISQSLLSQLIEELAEALSDKERIAITEKFLLSMLKPQTPDLLVLNAVRSIKKAQGNLTVGELSNQFYISQDAFEKRFRKLVGASPKQFAKIVRLREAIQLYSSVKSFTQLAHEAGYFDQAHFIKDFKTFTSQTPKSYFKSTRW